MRRLFSTFILIVAAITSVAATNQVVRISTARTDLVLSVSPKGRLCQAYLGPRLLSIDDVANQSTRVYAGSDGSYPERANEVMEGSGDETFFEPAIAITHNDGNRSTYLYYQRHEQRQIDGGTETVIRLADNRYPVEVKLIYQAYQEENVIKVWAEIVHHEKKAITLWRQNSGILYFKSPHYYLTSYHGDWAREAIPTTEELLPGKKIIDTKLGTRAAMQMDNFFALGIGSAAEEQQGQVMLGTTAWTGNFRTTFEVDNAGVLRVLPGINPYSSDYQLEPGQIFQTPEFIFTLSDNGTGQATRDLHDWARRHQLKDGMGERLTLLNNWENTGFRFDEKSLAQLMKDAKDLGVDMFLLDDGWFGNKHPRNDDHAGLGDWEANLKKLPNGLKGLGDAASQAGVKFGLWIEPEMVNPKSELFERHPDWAIHLPNRDMYYYRHQLVLDLSNPKVQEYVFSIVDKIQTQCPQVAYFKWDCNSPITNIYSPYLKQRQGNLYIDYVRGLYSVLDRIAQKYPRLQMMLCSGGGARCDYGALKYFTEFWCSDNTDPFERLYIQWSMSRFFPVKSMCSHVTNWNKSASVKFRVDVASMCKLGFDIDLKSLSPADYRLCQQAVGNYNRMKSVILDGDLYRLVSPYEGNHAAVNYVSKDKSRAVLFAYDLHPRYRELLYPVRLQGLDPQASYQVVETNLADGQQATTVTYSGDYLMKVGLDVFTANEGTSHVYELKRN